ncbi:receptor-like protein 12-like [Planoprotostelium fungivorum]|uniref:Receptor-like protein 12-like n=1 Tax=Planoprotostelium fungivorum TaxID=1890364 RepID=A0A2P6NC95_9EUKA|nr:receptor-like protein 12-like [Planoprotostelium fungivorum]
MHPLTSAVILYLCLGCNTLELQTYQWLVDVYQQLGQNYTVQYGGMNNRLICSTFPGLNCGQGLNPGEEWPTGISLNRPLNGSINPSIGNLVNLTTLHLESNISGSLPSSFTNLTRLQTLNISHNRFNGSILSILTNMTSLREIILDGNPLNTNIPPQLFQLPHLTYLSMSDCQLTGTIFQSNLLHNALTTNNITTLLLKNNSLRGTIYVENSALDASYNLFTSVVFSSHLTLSQCDLSHNNFPCYLREVHNCTVTPTVCNVADVLNGLYDRSTRLDVTEAEILLENITRSSMVPQLVSAVTSVLLRDQNSFNLRTKDVNLTVTTYNTSQSTAAINLSLNEISVNFPDIVAGNETAVSFSLSSLSYNAFGSIDSGQIYSPVVGVSLYDSQGEEKSVENTTQSINITIPFDSIPYSYAPTCLHWIEEDRVWSKNGCNSTLSDSRHVICHCNHLTNFSVGAEPSNVSKKNDDTRLIIIITTCVGGGILFISIGVVAYLVVRRKRYEEVTKGREMYHLSTQLSSDHVITDDVIYSSPRTVIHRARYQNTPVVVRKSKESSTTTNQISIVQRLHHPNIVQYFGYYIDAEEEACTILEYCPSGLYIEHFERGRVELTPLQMIQICMDVSSAMVYLDDIHMLLDELSIATVLVKCADKDYISKLNGFHISAGGKDKNDVKQLGLFMWEVQHQRLSHKDDQRWSSDVYTDIATQCLEGDIHKYREANDRLKQLYLESASTKERKNRLPSGLDNVYVEST